LYCLCRAFDGLDWGGDIASEGLLNFIGFLNL
jgi:hypothetical protein